METLKRLFKIAVYHDGDGPRAAMFRYICDYDSNDPTKFDIIYGQSRMNFPKNKKKV